MNISVLNIWLQEIPFRHIWNGTQNGLHCSFALEHVDRAETQLTCNILVCQAEMSSSQQVIHISRNTAQVCRQSLVQNLVAGPYNSLVNVLMQLSKH